MATVSEALRGVFLLSAVPNLGEVAQATSKGKNVREVLHRLTEV
jgi:hypothetical protein